MSTQTLPAVMLRKRQVYDRRFYLIMAIASVLLIFVGFSRTYFLKFHFPMSPALSVLVHIHGFVFSCWLIYFITQTALIAVNKPSLHRRLGLTGAFLGSAVILLGLLVAFTAARLHHGTVQQSWEVILLVGLIDISTFALFFVTGYVRRKDREAHQRLMMLSVVVGLTGPALGRLLNLGVPIPALSLINFALILAGPVYDLITRRRIHPVYLWGCLYAFATFTPLRFVVGATPWWHHVARILVGQ